MQCINCSAKDFNTERECLNSPQPKYAQSPHRAHGCLAVFLSTKNNNQCKYYVSIMYVYVHMCVRA